MRTQKVFSEGIQVIDSSIIPELEPEVTNTYLAIEDGYGTEHYKMETKIQKEYKRESS